MDTCPSGRQVEITYNDQRATVVEVGGGIRRYEVGSRSVFDPYPIDSMCDGAHGAPLIPWPNRLADGRYRFDEVHYQVALTEPEKQNAIHGFLRWRAWQVTRTSTAGVTMGVRLHPMQGYPFLIDVEVDYTLGGDGLTVTTTATNAGVRPCPYGAGQHPYLSPGVGLVDECTLQLDAGTRIVTDDERQLPTGTEAVDGTIYDFHSHASSGLRRWTSASPTSPGTLTVEPGLASGEPTADRQSSGLTRATRSSSSTPATPSHPNGDGRASAPSR